MPIYLELLIKPKKFLEVLPSEKITTASLAIILLLWANSIVQSLVVLKEYTFNVTLIFQELTILIFGIIVFSFILSMGCKVSKNRISFNQIVNIICFSQIPRLYFITLFTLLYLVFPKVLEMKMYNKSTNIIVLVLTIYSVILTTYGIAINVRKNKKTI